MYYYSYYDARAERETQEIIEGMRRWMAETVKSEEASRRLSIKLGLVKEKKPRSKMKR